MSARTDYVVDRYWLRHNTRCCRECGAKILFQQNPSTGKYLVLDVATLEPAPMRHGMVRMQSHFAVCSARARKAKVKEPARS